MHAREGLVDVLNLDHLAARQHLVLGAEVQQFLGLLQATDQRAGNRTVVDRQQCTMNGLQRLQRPHQHQRAVTGQEHQVGVDVVAARDGIEHQVKTAGRRFHRLRLAGQQHMMGAECAGIISLAGRGGDHRNLGAERNAKLDGHVAQAAQADDRQTRTSLDAVRAHWRPHSDACAQQRAGKARVQRRRHTQHKLLAHDDVLGVATAGHFAADAVQAVVGRGHAVGAMRFLVVLASRTLLAAVDQATDRDKIASTVTADGAAHGGDPADNLVAWYTGKTRGVPVVVHIVHVGMADAAVVDVDGDIVVTQRPTFETHRLKRRVGFMDAVADTCGHGGCSSYWPVGAGLPRDAM
ncbi:hypothetical protein D3C79_734110 [compost metagenome]